MDITKENFYYIQRKDNNESINGRILQELGKSSRESFFPKNYFFVTHLVNPIQAFFTHKGVKTEKSNELARKLFLGKKLERFASVWFRSIEGFSLEEGVLDGFHVGIPGVRGSADFMINDSIVEFKTKDILPESEEDIFAKYPQDIEQLSFYATIHPLNPAINHLVFMDTTPPYKIKAYKINISDFGRLKTLLLERIKLLKSAIENDDPSSLGKCRYFDEDCQFQESGCGCEKRTPLPISQLKSSLSIEFDSELTKTLETKKEEGLKFKDAYTTQNIICPRKHYFKEVENLEDDWQQDSEREKYLTCLGSLIRRLGFNLNPLNKEYIKKKLLESRFLVGDKWLKISTSIKPEGVLMPYLVKVSSTNNPTMMKPHDYHLTELAIICSMYGYSKGMIFVIYPKMDDKINAYEISFKNLDTLKTKVTTILDNLDKSIKNKDWHDLPECPSFMCDNCSFEEKCKS